MDIDELFHSEDLSWLDRPDREAESTFVERKQKFEPATVAEAVSAFGNLKPDGGLIVLGVSSKGERLGLPAAEVDDKLPRLADQLKLVPNWGWEVRRVPFEEKVLLLLRVPHSPRRVVLTRSGKGFARVGATTRELSPDQVRELQQNTGEDPFEDVGQVELALELLDADLLDAFQKRLAQQQTLPNTVEQDLENRRLTVNLGGKTLLTTAGVLIFAADPLRWVKGAYARVLRFEGAEERVGAERNTIKDETFEGPIPKVVPRLLDFVGSQLREFDHLGPAGLFIKSPELPRPAWEEAIVNAIVHRSYNLLGPVFIRLFDDRLEVESPGGFPGTVTPERFSHQPRNPNLAGALKHFDLVRLATEGTRRMRKEMSDAGLPAPRFEGWSDRVKVTLENDIEHRRPQKRNGALQKEWVEIKADLADPIALIRRKALERWRGLLNQGNPAPTEVIEAAAGRVTGDLPREERLRLLDLLISGPRIASTRKLLVDHGLSSDEWAADNDISTRLLQLAWNDAELGELALQWLERDWWRDAPSPPSAERVRLGAGLVQQYLAGAQSPPRDFLRRTLAALDRYPHQLVLQLRALIDGSA